MNRSALAASDGGGVINEQNVWHTQIHTHTLSTVIYHCSSSTPNQSLSFRCCRACESQVCIRSKVERSCQLASMFNVHMHTNTNSSAIFINKNSPNKLNGGERKNCKLKSSHTLLVAAEFTWHFS